MDIENIVEQLRGQRDRIDSAITVLERGQFGVDDQQKQVKVSK